MSTTPPAATAPLDREPGTDAAAARPAVLSDGTLPRRAASLTLLGWLLLGVALLVAGVAAAGCVLVVVVGHTATVYVWSRRVEGRRRSLDRLVTAVVTVAFLLAMTPLVSVVVTMVRNGLARFDAEFFTHSMLGVTGAGGGAHHAVLGTLVITAMATVISVPLGLLTAIYLVEYGRGRLARAITFLVDVMTGIPSIVAGLFAYAFFQLFLDPGEKVGVVGAVALSVLMTPVVVRSAEEMLKLVPNELREAAYALAVPKWRTVLKVVVPTAMAGIATGVTLAVARVVGETAPLLITVGVTTSDNVNPFDGPMMTLSVFSYNSYAHPGVDVQAYHDRAWTAALLLILIVMALNLLARLISRLFSPRGR